MAVAVPGLVPTALPSFVGQCRLDRIYLTRLATLLLSSYRSYPGSEASLDGPRLPTDLAPHYRAADRESEQRSRTSGEPCWQGSALTLRATVHLESMETVNHSVSRPLWLLGGLGSTGHRHRRLSSS